MNYSKLSHTISQALRHTPKDYGLNLDSREVDYRIGNDEVRCRNWVMQSFDVIDFPHAQTVEQKAQITPPTQSYHKNHRMQELGNAVI